MKETYYSAKAYCKGTNRNECQDFAAISKTKPIIALSDGAGSKTHAKKAAEELVSKAIEMMKADEKYTSENIFETINKHFYSKGYNPDEYGGTLLFVTAHEGKYFACHTGDGVIISRKDDEEKFTVLSYPENGMFLNETFFLPSQYSNNHTRIYSGEYKNSICFILASDGISSLLYNSEGEGMKCCNKLEDIATQDKADDRLKDSLENFFSQYSNDDLSVAVLVIKPSDDEGKY